MSKTALILVDFQADNMTQEDLVPALKKWGAGIDRRDLFIIACRGYTMTAGKRKKDTKGAKLHSYVSKVADCIVTKDSIQPSAFEGGTLRPIQSTEKILKAADVEQVIVGGYFLEWAVAQTAYDANALGYQTTVDLSITANENENDWHQKDMHARLELAGVKVKSATLV